MPDTLSTQTFPVLELLIRWDDETEIDEASYVESFTVKRSAWPTVSNMRSMSTSMYGTLVLQNTDWRFTPRRAGHGVDSSLHSILLNMPQEGFAVSISVGFRTTSGGPITEIYRWFMGRIIEPRYDETAATVLFKIVDALWLPLQDRRSLGVYKDYDVADICAAYGIPQVDPSPAQVSYAWLDNDSAMQDAFELASTVGGAIYPDEYGQLAFISYSNWYVNSQYTTIAFDPNYNYGNLESSANYANKATEVRVPYSPRVSRAPQILYTLDEALAIPPGSTETFEFHLSKPLVGDLGIEYAVTAGMGVDLADDVNVTTDVTAQTVTVTVSNTNAQLTAHLIKCVVLGAYIDGLQSREVKCDVAGASSAISRSLSAGGVFYIQNVYHATWLANVLANRNEREQFMLPPTRTVRDTDALLWLKLGDHVTYAVVRDVAPTSAFIYSMLLTYKANEGFTQTFELVDKSYLYPRDDYFIIGDILDNTKVASF